MRIRRYNTMTGILLKVLSIPFRLFTIFLISVQLKRCGSGCKVSGSVFISGGKHISLGKNCFLGRNVVLDARGGPIQIGDSTEIRDGVRIYAESVRVGSGVTIGENSFLVGKITVGDKVWIARNCDLTGDVLVEQAILGPGASCVGGADHPRDPVTNHILMNHETLKNQGTEKTCVVIRKGAWIGQNAILLKGVEIGEGAVVGAGSVVTRCVRSSVTVAGNPAREIHE